MCHAHGVAISSHVFVLDENVYTSFVGLKGDHIRFCGAVELCRRAYTGAEYFGVVRHGDSILWTDGALRAGSLDHFVHVLYQPFGLS